MSNPLFQALQLLKELPSIITGINATKYLSGESISSLASQPAFWEQISAAAGFVILLYDHLLLLEEEVGFPVRFYVSLLTFTQVDLIWAARWGWLKILFFFNRYTVPAFIGLTTYGTEIFQISGNDIQIIL